MWPDDGRGYEPSTYSPAGHAAVEWRFIRALGMRRTSEPGWVRATRAVLATMLLVFVAAFVFRLAV